MSADNPVQRMFKNPEKEGGTRIEIDCEKGIMVVRVTKPHSITGKTEMTKVNVDYHTIGRVSPWFILENIERKIFRLSKTPLLCFSIKLLDHSRHMAEKTLTY